MLHIAVGLSANLRLPAGVRPTAAIDTTLPSVAAMIGVSKFVMDLGLILTAGLLVVALALPNSAGTMTDQARALLRSSRVAAAMTAIATAAFAFATTADVMAVGLGDIARNSSFLESLLLQTTLGRALLWQLGFLIAYGVLCPLFNQTTSALVLALPLLATVTSRAATGHSGNSSWHMAAIESWALHIAALCTWMGAIFVMAWMLIRRKQWWAIDTLPRLNTLIRACAIVVIASGFTGALVRLNRVSELFSSRYGLLISAKTLASVALLTGLLALIKKHTINASLARWLTAQCSLLLVTVATAVVLSRTTPPFNPDANVSGFSPLRQVLGFPPPPKPSASDLVWAQIRPDVFWIFIAVLSVWIYLRAARSLKLRGDHWSRGRTAAWLAGMLVLTYATSGPLGVYGHIFFSAHMAQHLLLVMVAPLLLVLGAPVTLALRYLPANRERTGAREWLLARLHSRYLRVVSHPLIAFVNFIGGFFALYFSGLFELLMRSHSGHLLMQAHFLISGYLFFLAVIGTDPAPRTLPAPARVGLAVLAAPVHAVFSVIVMQSTSVLAAGYFKQFANSYGIDALHDQYVGSSLGWAFGEVPMVVMVIVAVTQWVRADAREAARFDRWDDEQRARTAKTDSAVE